MENVMQAQQTELTGESETWLELPLVLSPEVERLTGADFQPMLYLQAERRYIRLSRGAAGLLDALDGATTAEQILARVTGAGDSGLEARRRQTVLQTIDGLRRAGTFTLDRGRDTRADLPRWRRRLARSPKLRVTRGIDPVVAKPAALAVRHPRATRLSVIALVLASLFLCVAAAVRLSAPTAVLWPAVFAVVLVEVAVHELAHAAVCRVFGVGVREAGLMLWGWFLPLAYVDCTDTYRLPAKRPRVLVALAGPFVDLVAGGVCAAVMLGGHGELSGTASVIYLSLLLMLARNLMPLLPTDGYHALQAATGELNLRRRAWSHLRGWAGSHSIRRRPTTETIRPSRTRREKVYIAYGLASVFYTLVTLGLVILEIHELARIIG